MSPIKKTFLIFPHLCGTTGPAEPSRPLGPLPKGDGLQGKAFVLLNYTRIFFYVLFSNKVVCMSIFKVFFIFLKRTDRIFRLNHLPVVQYLNSKKCASLLEIKFLFISKFLENPRRFFWINENNFNVLQKYWSVNVIKTVRLLEWKYILYNS